MPTGDTYQGKVWIGTPDGRELTELKEAAIVTVPVEYDAEIDNIYLDMPSWEVTCEVKNKRRLIASLGMLLSRGESKMPRKKMRKYRKYRRMFMRRLKIMHKSDN